MMTFSEYFTIIKDRRKLTGAQIAEMCNLETGMVFHWLNGKRYPQDWQKVEEVAEKLKLSNEECRNLRDAYERTVLGAKEYYCNKKIMNIIRVLEEKRDIYFHTEQNTFIETRNVQLPDFIKLNNRIEILSWLQNALEYLLSKKEQRLYLKFHDINAEVLTLLKMYCNRTMECKIEEVVYLQKEEIYSGMKNLEALEGVIEFLVQKKEVEVYCQEDLDYDKDFAENWIISDDFVLQYDVNLSSGMLAGNREWVESFKASFEKIKQKSDSLGKKGCILEPDMERTRFRGYSMEYMPCIGNGLTKEILEKYMYKEIPNREMMIDSILESHVPVGELAKMQWCSIFSKEGLIEFMETGRLDTFPSDLYRKIEVESCCEVLQNIIHNAKAGYFTFYVKKEKKLPLMRNLYIEQIVDKKPRLYMHLYFERGMKEAFKIDNKEIQECFLNFFRHLEKGGYVYSKEESLAYMQRVLEEYKKYCK